MTMKGLGRVWIFTALATASLIGASQPIRVTIDVKPGDEPTTIEPDREGMMPVAILSTAQFDASTVDPRTIRVGPTGTEAEPFRSMTDDVNRDGRTDMMALIRVQDLRVKCGDKLIRLSAKTKAGVDVEGSEAVVLEGCPG
jgi:hypothetical protein